MKPIDVYAVRLLELRAKFAQINSMEADLWAEEKELTVEYTIVEDLIHEIDPEFCLSDWYKENMEGLTCM